MTHRVRILRLALRDLREIHDYLLRDGAAAADAVTGRIFDAIETLSSHPRRGSAPRDAVLKRRRYRILVVEAFLVFYKVIGREVRVYRVLRGKRSWAELL